MDILGVSRVTALYSILQLRPSSLLTLPANVMTSSLSLALRPILEGKTGVSFVHDTLSRNFNGAARLEVVLVNVFSDFFAGDADGAHGHFFRSGVGLE